MKEDMKLKKRGKKYEEAIKLVDRTKTYDLREAVTLLKKTATANFDETVELAFRLGVDPKQADQNIRGAVVLPHGTGKTQRVLVFAKGEKIKEAEEAGADYIGDEEIIAKINGGWFDFDVIVATPDMMGEVGKLGRVLGPKELMMKLKNSTVTFELANAVNDIKAGKVEFSVDKSAKLHVIVGKVSFEDEQLIENLEAMIETVVRVKPQSSKGKYIRNAAIASTMGPGVKDRKSTRLNSSHVSISYAVFCLKKKNKQKTHSNIDT